MAAQPNDIGFKVSDHGWRVKSSSPVPLKTFRVVERCTLNLLRAQMSPISVVWKRLACSDEWSQRLAGGICLSHD
ncbi:hypothetical protein TNCV_3479751 [Trichonephila clavipes]|nr:hypothetical protein TNCV_3479751 [Trichonephila clavipes]